MVYSNIEFLFLLLPTLLFFSVCRSHAQRFVVLLAASLIFYGWAGVLDALIFLAVIVVSWVATYLAKRDPLHKRAYLNVGIAIMVFHLFFWKYAPWLVSQIQIHWPHFNAGRELSLPLPVGISFFTLQGIAYLVDFGRGQAEFISFKEYLLFKSFFAQLVAGPIVRVPQLLPQLQRLKKIQWESLVIGLSLFCLGWVKKVLIADRSASLVDAAFSFPDDFNRQTLLWAVIGYSLQIWGDFSGYTDMGRGVARMLGIRLPENFLSPYLSTSPSEFWKRWHITLSQWIRDYIYIPLGGGRGSVPRVCFVVLLTMAISGLWHGANWTFVLWGVFHGALLVMERLRVSFFPAKAAAVGSYVWLRNLILMQVGVATAWTLFRAESLSKFIGFWEAVIKNDPSNAEIGAKNVIAALALGVSIQIVSYRRLETGEYPVLSYLRGVSKKFLPRKRAFGQSAWMGALCGVLLALTVLTGIFFRSEATTPDFIYFRF